MDPCLVLEGTICLFVPSDLPCSVNIDLDTETMKPLCLCFTFIGNQQKHASIAPEMEHELKVNDFESNALVITLVGLVVKSLSNTNTT